MRAFLVMLILGVILVSSAQVNSPRAIEKGPVYVLDSIVDTLVLPCFCDSQGRKISSTTRVFYPVFKGELAWLNEEVEKMVLMEANLDSLPSPKIKNYFVEYNRMFNQYLSDSGSIDWYCDNSCGVESLSDSLVTLSQGAEMYTGGAHPYHYACIRTFHLRKRKMMRLSDYLKRATDTVAIKNMALKELRKTKNLKPGERLDDEGSMFITDETFYLSNNFYFTDSTLSFFYNDYEVQAYAFGPVEISLPKIKLKGLLK